MRTRLLFITCILGAAVITGIIRGLAAERPKPDTKEDKKADEGPQQVR